VFPTLSSFAATLTEEEVETLRSDPSVSTHARTRLQFQSTLLSR
jgi:hypothetical protein